LRLSRKPPSDVKSSTGTGSRIRHTEYVPGRKPPRKPHWVEVSAKALHADASRIKPPVTLPVVRFLADEPPK
jgi:hypothetical protein